VFQADREQNGFQWIWVRLVNAGSSMEFGPVEEAVKDLLAFLAQILAKICLLSPLLF
jgi:hypothetical protein